jgi:hypothetical protein
MLSTIGHLRNFFATPKIDAKKSCFYGQKITKKVTLEKKKEKKKSENSLVVLFYSDPVFLPVTGSVARITVSNGQRVRNRSSDGALAPSLLFFFFLC